MRRDGTPETDLEEWLLEMGLGLSYAITTDAPLTKAQMDALAESKPDPVENPKHHWLMEELVSHTDKRH